MHNEQFESIFKTAYNECNSRCFITTACTEFHLSDFFNWRLFGRDSSAKSCEEHAIKSNLKWNRLSKDIPKCLNSLETIWTSPRLLGRLTRQKTVFQKLSLRIINWLPTRWDFHTWLTKTLQFEAESGFFPLRDPVSLAFSGKHLKSKKIPV